MRNSSGGVKNITATLYKFTTSMQDPLHKSSMGIIERARRRYWNFRSDFGRLRSLTAPSRHAFAREVLSSHWRHLSGRRGVQQRDSDAALAAAIAWLLRAQRATADDGVSLGYFPCERERGWRPSYPETTGYIIQTLLARADVTGDTALRERALAAADWEIHIQMPSGGVQGGPVCPPELQREAVFNTGMVLQGWTAAFRASGARRYLEAGRKAADFLVGDLDESGHFRTHGSFVCAAKIKTYNVLCAWALLRFSEDSGEVGYRAAAIRNAEAAAAQQDASGWFANNDLTDPDRPLTHTIGYTLQGLLEVGVEAARPDLITVVRRGVEPILATIEPDGYLAGRFDAQWRPAIRSSCLTGSAQIAIVLYRLYQLSGDQHYRNAADRLVLFLIGEQRAGSSDPNVNGAIPGSSPLFGSYMKAGYPNWATKYFADALMLQAQTRPAGMVR
jgi:hypothetical protein